MNLSGVEINDPVVVINIHQQFPFVRNEEDLYECTRGLWRLDAQRAGRARYLFAVYLGIIKEVYEIQKCIPASSETKEYWRKRLLSQGREISPALNDSRCEFDGQVAAADIREKYVNRRMPVRLTQNPVRYFNC
ncbi:MAG TPA: hypothetical protein VGO68_11475 [Pyrinomonadaceae bacterium]|jgi:hypothetical protein|nr:hypothetical protein [Pyrinomonadaceae bacterium]